MPAPISRAPASAAKFAAHAWWILLLAALVWHGMATQRRIDRVNALTNLPTWSGDAPARDGTSPSGYEKGQRKLIVPGHHNPSFWWIMEAQQSAERGNLRLRHVDYDAQPDGRDVRRTALYRWWLITVGRINGAVTGEPLGYAIERGALIADPVLFALFLILGTAYSARFIGSMAAAGFVLGGTSVFPLAANFPPGAPDPHSLSTVLVLGSIIPLLAVGARRRTHFIVAGIFGGLGLWNNASSQAPVLLAISVGALGYEFIRTRGAGRQPTIQSSWRAWALAGTLTTLGASLFEFAPGYFSWSLDSVNPIHAIAWWGLGEALCAAGVWSREGRKGVGGRSLARVGVAGLAIAAWPVVGILSGSGALLASDFYALELANHPGGGFATNLGAWLHQAGNGGAKWATLLPSLLILVLLGRIFPGQTPPEERGRLVLVLVPTIFSGVMACLQLRSWNLFDALALVGLTTLLADDENGSTRLRLRTFSAVLMFLPGLFVGFPSAVDGKTVKGLSPLEAQALIARDYSYWLNRRAGMEPNVLYSTPVFSSAAAFYGNFAVVTSSDGENRTGHLTAVRIASAATPQEGLILLNSRGITHVALPLWDPMLDQLVRIGMSLPSDQPLPKGAFAVAIREWYLPMWLRPLDYLIPHEPGFQGFELRAFALQPEQEPELGLSRLTDFFLDRGQLEEATVMRENLKDYPRSVIALGTMANVDFALRDRARLMESLETLIPLLSRRAARNLPADRRISLADLLLRTNHADLAREQLTACMEAIDAATLRTLTPGSVVSLLMLSRSLEIPFPDNGSETIALELIPPSVRDGITKR